MEKNKKASVSSTASVASSTDSIQGAEQDNDTAAAGISSFAASSISVSGILVLAFAEGSITFSYGKSNINMVNVFSKIFFVKFCCYSKIVSLLTKKFYKVI